MRMQVMLLRMPMYIIFIIDFIMPMYIIFIIVFIMPMYIIFVIDLIITHHALPTSMNRANDSLPRSHCSALCTPDLPT
jgi:hypothetical protein